VAFAEIAGVNGPARTAEGGAPPVVRGSVCGPRLVVSGIRLYRSKRFERDEDNPTPRLRRDDGGAVTSSGRDADFTAWMREREAVGDVGVNDLL
jgi:hypothetical protein